MVMRPVLMTRMVVKIHSIQIRITTKIEMKKGEIRMPYDVKRFIFSVSLCAMLAANPVLATAPTNDEDLGTTHDVYVESTLNQATNGIAGVSYVNRMVNAAGNAAELAEGHAAAAGAHALSAAQSAAEAHKVLADKVNIDQGEDNKNKVMVTDDAGSVYPGYVSPSMIDASSPGPKVLVTLSGATGIYADWGDVEPSTIKAGFIDGSGNYFSYDKGKVLIVNSGGFAEWGVVGQLGIANSAVTTDKIASGAVRMDKIADNTIHLGKLRYINAYASGVVSDGIPLITDGATGLALSQISSVGIADGAVTADKIGADTSAISVGPNTQSFMYAYETGDGRVEMRWGQIRSAGIAPGAVTIEKTAGVVGMVPVGGEGATTYGSFWIE